MLPEFFPADTLLLLQALLPGNSWLQAQAHWDLYSETRKMNSCLRNRYVILRGFFSKERNYVQYVAFTLGLAGWITRFPALFTSYCLLFLRSRTCKLILACYPLQHMELIYFSLNPLWLLEGNARGIRKTANKAAKSHLLFAHVVHGFRAFIPSAGFSFLAWGLLL